MYDGLIMGKALILWGAVAAAGGLVAALWLHRIAGFGLALAGGGCALRGVLNIGWSPTWLRRRPDAQANTSERSGR